MRRFYVSAHLAMTDPAVSDQDFAELLQALNDSLPAELHARASGLPADFVVGARIDAENEEAAREIWFASIDGAIRGVGLEVQSRYSSRLRFESIS